MHDLTHGIQTFKLLPLTLSDEIHLSLVQSNENAKKKEFYTRHDIKSP